MATKAPKYLAAGIERLAMVVARSERAVGRTAAGRAVRGAVEPGAVVRGDGGLADLHDRRARERGDDAGGDLEVHRLLGETGHGPVEAAGRHHRGADGQG